MGLLLGWFGLNVLLVGAFCFDALFVGVFWCLVCCCLLVLLLGLGWFWVPRLFGDCQLLLLDFLFGFAVLMRGGECLFIVVICACVSALGVVLLWCLVCIGLVMLFAAVLWGLLLLGWFACLLGLLLRVVFFCTLSCYFVLLY